MNFDLTSITEKIKVNAYLTEKALESYGQGADADLQEIFDAQAYSLLGGGKRIRPFIVNEVCIALGGQREASMPFAVALEMIHTYSLIHDDLPCMDDDDMRRGKPTNHKVFGYSTALLAGDALLTKAFSVVAGNGELDHRARAEAVKLLADAAGECGMIGGQIIDLAGEKKRLEFGQLLRLHSLKTGALIRCAAGLGAIAAGYYPESEEFKAATEYADGIGLAFQVIDDVLDATSTADEIGKSVGGDADHNKTTFMTYFDVEGARAYAEEVTNKAISAISEWENSGTLIDLAAYLLERKY